MWSILLPRVCVVELQLLASVMAARTLSEEGLDLPDNPSQPSRLSQMDVQEIQASLLLFLE